MNINLPARVRKTLYVVTGIVNIAMIYLAATGAVSSNETAAWAALNAFIAGLAGYNVNPDIE